MSQNYTVLRGRCAYLIQQHWVHIVLISLLGVAVYSNSFHVPFVLDDNGRYQYFGSKSLQELLLNGGARRIVDATFALNYKIHGNALPGYHFTNLLVHLLSATTLYYFVQSVLDTAGDLPDTKETFTSRFIPLAAALLFVAHPLQTQAVTYTIQRYTSMATLFYIFSALAFVRFRCTLDRKQSHRAVWTWALLSLVSALLAFGCKQIAATLPAMLIALEIILFNGRFLTRRFATICGLLLLAVPVFLLFQWFNGTLGDFLYDLRHATSDNQFMSRGTYFITQIRVVATYLRLLVFPVNQNLLYDYPVYNSLLTAPVLTSLMLHLSLAGIALYMLMISRRIAVQNCYEIKICLRLAALGITWFYLTLAVESSVIPIRDLIFEHRVYLPSAGIFMAVCSLTSMAVQTRKSLWLPAWITLTVACLVLGSLTFARNRIWGDPLALWQDTVSKAPNNALSQANLASELLKRNMPDKAIPLFLRAIELDQNLDFQVKNDLGIAMKALNLFDGRFTTGQEYVVPGGDFNGGVLDYRRFKEWDAGVSNNMALAYEYYGEQQKALDSYVKAVWINPDFDIAWFNFGLFGARHGNGKIVTDAAAQLQKINPVLAAKLKADIGR